MTTNAIDISTRRQRPSRVPGLPAVARDPLDDIRELLFSFDAKQAGDSDTCYADLCDSMAAALRTALAILTRPAASHVLRPLAILDVAQAEQFVLELDSRTQGADLPAAMYMLGRLAEHTKALLDVVYATTRMPR